MKINLIDASVLGFRGECSDLGKKRVKKTTCTCQTKAQLFGPNHGLLKRSHLKLWVEPNGKVSLWYLIYLNHPQLTESSSAAFPAHKVRIEPDFEVRVVDFYERAHGYALNMKGLPLCEMHCKIKRKEKSI